MAFVSGTMLIDAPASALNNSKRDDAARNPVTPAKFIWTFTGKTIPYVSAQAVRFWIRTSLANSQSRWAASPTYKENENLAYADGNPIKYWDDDLFGYMRAPTAATRERRKVDPEYSKLTELEEEKKKEVSLTRISPFRVSTFIGVAPVNLVNDWGTMSRHNGDPVLHQHQFYQATLKGMFSLNLATSGTFFNGGRVGYRNLDKIRMKLAREANLEEVTLHGQPAFRLPAARRAERVAALIRAIGELEGGAKLALHYTDVTPPLVLAAVIKGGNNPLSRALGANSQGDPEFNIDAFAEALRVYKDQLLSDVFVGWARGYLDGERAKLVAMTDEERCGVRLRWGHPREAMAEMASELAHESRHSWYD